MKKTGCWLLGLVDYFVVLDVLAIDGFEIREEPEDTVITQLGHVHTATLYCKTNSQDNLTITTWYKDDVNVEEGSLPFYNITKESLVVQTTSFNDPREILEGLYYCVINNGTANIRSKSAYIRGARSILFNPPKNPFSSIQATVVVAQSGYLQLPVSDNRPFWLVDCESFTIICTSTSCPFWHDVSVTGQLVVSSVLRIRYSEIRNNIDKCRNESTIRVIGTIGTPRMEGAFTFKDTISLVPRAYIINIKNQNIFVKVGSNATLYCISTHISSSYTWTTHGSVIVVDMKISLLIDGVLHIQNVTEQDSGQYECTATATFSSFGVQTRKVSWNVTVYSLPRVTLSLSQLNDTRTEQVCNTTNLVVPCILNHLPTTVKCQAKGSFPMLIQLFRNAQLLLKQKVTNADHTVQHTISSPRSGIYQCIARNEYGSKQSSLYATVSGVVPTVSATSRSSTISATFPSMSQFTASDYVTTTSPPHTLVTKSSNHYSSSSTSQHLPTNSIDISSKSRISIISTRSTLPSSPSHPDTTESSTSKQAKTETSFTPTASYLSRPVFTPTVRAQTDFPPSQFCLV
ncbi:peroxidasin homolog isoform X2 [Corticium candelabrum]|uniref:peroxidasin homolog isoform X2 n=1 Tax=Corticium candelabrum TaxID=121492 RepID=UPI002E2666E7|nr:peroxidasin homolog isoform X2 [Corticium candelabrum]